MTYVTDISLKRLKSQSPDGSIIYKVKCEDSFKLNRVKLVDNLKGLFKCHTDHFKLILDIEEIVTSIVEKKHPNLDIINLFVSNIILTKEHGQVFKYKKLENPIGNYDILLNLSKIKVTNDSIKIYWNCTNITPLPLTFNCNIELNECQDDCLNDQEEPEPDPYVLETLKQELLSRIDTAKKTYIEKLDKIALDVTNMTNLDISSIEIIEEALVAL